MNLTPTQVAAQVARDIPDGAYVNLGIGQPVLVGNEVPHDREIVFHSENGMLGMGPAPAPGEGNTDLINAAKGPVTLLPGGSYFHHTDSFLMMRGGHIDISVLGAFEVSAAGDLANWSTGDMSKPPAVGGAMDLSVGAKQLFVMMTHRTKGGTPKIVERCSYPLTAARVVSRIYTDLAVLDIDDSGLVVTAMVESLSPDRLRELTAAPLRFAEEVRTIPAPRTADRSAPTM
ncbi:3-oxoacid CoA-transferase subunit B [Janibacter sp. LM]|uniref:3-oxoacid CoA-transferase subunit B n=1 Tax=Janibacter sp. LM TaxID=3144845 RepID=UPI0031F624CA